MRGLVLLIVLGLCCLGKGLPNCEHAGGPLSEKALMDYLKKLVQPFIPYSFPSIEIDIGSDLSFNISQIVLQTLDFDQATMQLLQPNTVLFDLNGLTSSLSLDWTIYSNAKTQTGTGALYVGPGGGTITARLEQDNFRNINATADAGDMKLQTSNQPLIEPYWDILKPILMDTIQREIPNFILELNTSQIKPLVYPIVVSIEPLRLPDINESALGFTGGLYNLLLQDIDFTSATMGKGAMDNEVIFELVMVEAKITNNWAISGFGFTDSGTGHISFNETTVSVNVGISEISGGFAINLDNANIKIGGLEIKIDSGNAAVLDWFLQVMHPLIIQTIQDSFQIVVCLLFNGIPN